MSVIEIVVIVFTVLFLQKLSNSIYGLISDKLQLVDDSNNMSTTVITIIIQKMIMITKVIILIKKNRKINNSY